MKCVHVRVCMCVCVRVLLLFALRKGAVMASDGEGAIKLTLFAQLSLPPKHIHAHDWLMAVALLSVFAPSVSTFQEAFLSRFLAPLPSSSPSALHHETHPQFTQ